MRKFLIMTASTLALSIAGAGIAAAADEAAPARPLTPTSPGAGAIKKDDALKTDPGMDERRATVPIPDSARSADTAGFRSYKDSNGKTDASIAGGVSADALIGAEVMDPSGNEIGEVQDLIIGNDNKIEKAIVEVGGFLGVGSKTVAVEIAQLKPTGKKKGYITAMTKEELKTRTEFEKKSGSWVERYN